MPAYRNDQEKQEVFDCLVEPILPGLQKYMLKFAKSQFEADDLANEALARAFKKFDQYKHGTNFRAWIYRIAYTNFINKYRSAQNKPQNVIIDEDCEEFFLGEKETADFLDDEENKLTDDDIKQIVQRLPKDKRQIIYCYYTLGLKYKDISEALGVPIGTVMSRLNRAKQDVRKEVVEELEKRGLTNDA